MNILQACADPHLFGPWFKRPATWAAWRVFLAALFGLPMARGDLALFRKYTGRKSAPKQQAREAWLVVGRRGGKSFIVALIAVYLACFRDYRAYLSPGERGVVTVTATDRKQARVIFRYVRALLEGVAMLARLIERVDTESIDLTNRISIEIHTSSFRAVRGYTIVAAINDEIAFWRSDDSANPDHEVLDAQRPAMATIPGALLLNISSPYSQHGAMYEAFKRYFGQEGGVLVWQAETRAMNPTVPQAVIDEAYERDPVAAAAEYGAQFRNDIETFIQRAVVEACTGDAAEFLPVPGVRYAAFTDPSGGSADAMTLAIGHKDGAGRAVLDAVRVRRPPFSPESVVSEYALLLKSYCVSEVSGDRYAGEWPRERFRQHGIAYEPAAKTRSELYLELLPLLNSGQAVLLKNSMLLVQLCGLERRTSRAGRDTIDHAPGAHDDLANAVAGVLVGLQKPAARPSVRSLDYDGPAQQIRTGLYEHWNA